MEEIPEKWDKLCNNKGTVSKGIAASEAVEVDRRRYLINEELESVVSEVVQDKAQEEEQKVGEWDRQRFWVSLWELL